MPISPVRPRSTLVTAMVCVGALNAQFIAGKATRDALFLANVDVASLPTMVMATAAFSIALVALGSRGLRSFSPSVVVPVAFAVNALLLLLEWALAPVAPVLAARAVYLQISGVGPMLGSGFWLIATDRFDPHTARHSFGRLAAVGALSGLAGALVADRIAAAYGITAVLPVLAGLNLLCAWKVRQLARDGTGAAEEALDSATDLVVASPVSAWKTLADRPYLRDLAAFVLLGTIGAALADYVFKVQVVETLGRGDEMLRFFAVYYGVTTLLAFAVQTTAGTAALERLGLAVTASTPALALCAGGIGAIAIPGLPPVAAARGAESVLRGSLFRTGYEIFFTPIPAAEKRAAKSAIDVGVDRLGDAIGGGIVRAMLLLPSSRRATAILSAAVVAAALALLVARRLNRGYILTLERSLLNRAVELDVAAIEDTTTRTIVLRTLKRTRAKDHAEAAAAAAGTAIADVEVQEILALRSRDRERVLQVLRDENGLPASLVPHTIPLLAWDAVAQDAVRALRKVAEEYVGELTDALVNPNQPFAVRRRVARVLAICVSQRAFDGLMLGLEDPRFEVRFQAGRAMGAILEKSAFVRVHRERVFDAIRREVTVSRPVWEGQRLLDATGDRESFVDEFIKDRAGQSLAHVFTLLSLVLPALPLQVCYRGLHTDDPKLRGTALEYLEGVLPPDIRNHLWPFLGTEPSGRGHARDREEILADLMRSNESIVLNIQELRRRGGVSA
jgi:AAA family ATP:ADP antiporter